jgi:DNA topoisomerase-1
VAELFVGGNGERELGEHPETGDPIVLRSGRYGPYVSHGDKNASLLRSQSPERLSLVDALRVLSLPRLVGTDPRGEEIYAASGRYGPYLKRGTDTRSLEREEQLFTITVEEALARLAEPKARGRQAAAAPPLKELGTDPVTERPVVVKDGRFGPYVTDGETNASLRRGMSVAAMTLDQASQMLLERRAQGPAAPRKKAAKKATAKKATAKKATGAKTTAARNAAAKQAGAKQAAAKKAAAKKAAAKQPASQQGAAKKTTVKRAPEQSTPRSSRK